MVSILSTFFTDPCLNCCNFFDESTVEPLRQRYQQWQVKKVDAEWLSGQRTRLHVHRKDQSSSPPAAVLKLGQIRSPNFACVYARGNKRSHTGG